jgi:cell division protein FtsL
MHRAINSILMLATLVGLFALYAIKDGTRRLEARVQAQERALERAENDVSVLAAERAHLARPERLEPLARKLGMTPVSSGQYLRVEARMESPLPCGDGLGLGGPPTAEVGDSPSPCLSPTREKGTRRLGSSHDSPRPPPR